MEPPCDQPPKDHESPPKPNGKEPSLTSRIAESASGLARTFVTGSSRVDWATDLASGSGLTGKAENGSSSSSAFLMETSSLRTANGRSKGQTISSSTSLAPESFRTPSQQSERISDAFETFTDYEPEFEQEARMDVYSPWASEFQRSAVSPSHTPEGPAQQFHSPVFGHSIENSDGAAVVALLSNPSFIPDIDMPSVEPEGNEPSDLTTIELFGNALSSDQQEIVDRIKSSLPAPPNHAQVPVEHPLNLRPAFEEGVNTISPTFEDARDYVSTWPLSAQQSRIIADWNDVLNSYTDEVWGELLPAVNKAKSQLEEVKTGVAPLDNKSVARLKMILGHVLQHEDSTVLGMPGSRGAQQTARNVQHVNGTAVIPSSLEKASSVVYGDQERLYQNGATHTQQNSGYNRTEPANNVAKDGVFEGIPDMVFHCPWISCHQRFLNVVELRIHTESHSMLACPHVGCESAFQKTEEWVEHTRVPHHDLLMPMPYKGLS